VHAATVGDVERRRFESRDDQVAGATGFDAVFRWRPRPTASRINWVRGPIITATGLVFIAGTFDPYIRAFDVQTGKELWKAQLPASGNATPMTYSVNAKQYLVIAAGGHP
jgi:outer membrane protein assembly factor BamB